MNNAETTSKVFYTKVPNAAVVERIPELGKAAVLVYLILAYHADEVGYCFPSLSLISRKTGFKRNTVCKALGVLKRNGLIEVEHGKGGKGNEYKLTTLCGSTKRDTTLQPDSTKRDTQTRAQRDTQVGPKGIQELEPLTKPIKQESSCRTFRFDEGDREIAEWMFSLIRKLNPKHKEPNLEHWANDIRLMREQDKRTPEDIRAVFAWANSDSFWHKNILSPEKLRKQFDQLTLNRNGDTNNGNHTSNGHRPGRVEAEPGKYDKFE